MKVTFYKLVAIAAVGAASVGMSGCVSYGNTHALLTPVGVAGYHTFKPPQNSTREIKLPPERDPNRVAAAKAKEEQAADRDTET